MGAEVFRPSKALLHSRALSTLGGDEGGFAAGSGEQPMPPVRIAGGGGSSQAG